MIAKSVAVNSWNSPTHAAKTFAEILSMETSLSSIEILEARIAPAAVFTYTDIDGDRGHGADLERAPMLTSRRS